MIERLLQEALSKQHPIAVCGVGASGIAVTQFLLARGFSVLAIDERTAEFPACEVFARDYSDRYELLKGVSVPTVLAERAVAKLVMLSPGVAPSKVPRELHVTNELELGLILSRANPLCVTGSAGKSTTSALLHHLLVSAGVPSILLGNIGTPVVSRFEELCRAQSPVIEISSYQIEQSREFVPAAALFLGLSENHLERHGSIENYFQVKASLFRRLPEGSTFICNRDCDYGRRLALELCEKTSVASFGFSTPMGCEAVHATVSAGKIELSSGARIDSSSFTLLGRHNQLNLMAAILGAVSSGVDEQEIAPALASFNGLAHRMELFFSTPSMRFINDSKSTTPVATATALRALSLGAGEGLYVLIGGQHKQGLSWEPVLQEINRRRSDGIPVDILYFGASAAHIREELGLEGRCFAHLATLLKQGELRPEAATILLSPGCASFDEFGNFEERGNVFKSWVRKRFAVPNEYSVPYNWK